MRPLQLLSNLLGLTVEIKLLTPSQTIPPSRDYRKTEMSVITVSEPVPDITGVVNNICILCDSTGAFEEGIPYKMEEDTSLDVYYLLSLMRDILKVRSCTAAMFNTDL